MKILLLSIALLNLTLYSHAENKEISVVGFPEKVVILLDTLSQKNIDLKSIKKKFENEYTSGFVRKTRSDSLYVTINGNNIGRYTFLYMGNDADAYWVSAELVVGVNEMPWMYYNDTDVFVELTVHNCGICIFDNIQVTSDKATVIKALGNPDKTDHQIEIYKFEKANLIALFFYEGDKVKCYRAGYYRQEVLSDLKKHLPQLSKQLGDCRFDN